MGDQMSKALSLEAVLQTVDQLWLNSPKEKYHYYVTRLLTEIYKDGNSFVDIRATPTPADAYSLSFDVDNICSSLVITCQIENEKISFLNKGERILPIGCDLPLIMGMKTAVDFIFDYLNNDQYEILETMQDGEIIKSKSNSLGQAISLYLNNLKDKLQAVCDVVISIHDSKLTMTVDEHSQSNTKKQLRIYSDELSPAQKSIFLLALGYQAGSADKPFNTSKSDMFYHVWR